MLESSALDLVLRLREPLLQQLDLYVEIAQGPGRPRYQLQFLLEATARPVGEQSAEGHAEGSQASRCDTQIVDGVHVRRAPHVAHGRRQLLDTLLDDRTQVMGQGGAAHRSFSGLRRS